MKKFIFVVVLCFMLFPTLLNAEVKTVGGIQYSIKEVEYSDVLFSNIIGLKDLDNVLVSFNDPKELKMFNGTEFREEPVTRTEVLNRIKEIDEKYGFMKVELTLNNGYKIIHDNYDPFDPVGVCYKPTEDLTIDPLKTYYRNGPDGIEEVAAPVEADMLWYSERTACISETIKEYTDEQNAIINAIRDEFLNDTQKFNKATEFRVFKINDEIILSLVLWYTDRNEEESTDNPYKFIAYYFNEDMEEMPEFKNYTYISYSKQAEMYLNYDNENWHLLDKNFNKIYTIENYFSLLFAYDKNTVILDSMDGKYFEITRHMILEGKEQIYSGKDLVIKYSADKSRFKTLKINNAEVNTELFDVTQGSTIITLKKEYLDTLKPGEYTVLAEFDAGGSVETKFTIKESVVEETKKAEASNPKTNDAIYSYVLLGILSVAGTIVIKKKSFS